MTQIKEVASTPYDVHVKLDNGVGIRFNVGNDGIVYITTEFAQVAEAKKTFANGCEVHYKLLKD